MTLTAKSRIADIIKSMTYEDLIDLANDLVDMQKEVKDADDGWEWKPNETYGEFGLASMLHSWALAQDEEDKEEEVEN